MGKVTLIGAGPGDASLITVRGLEKLKHCDVVIYDRLASEELLAAAREDCIFVYVGKKPGAHSMRQEEINRVLVEYGRKYENVVRLKGGDPFVFGRGGEEIMALAQAGIPYEVVPGVTSAIAVPGLAGIPVTHRGIARSFYVITGHTADDGAPEDYAALSKLSGTLVFLMGLSNLEKIAGELLIHGKSPDTPAAVIAEGATSYERIVRGTLSDIAERVRAAELSSPVVIVIGEVAKLSLRWEHDRREDGSGTAERGATGEGVTGVAAENDAAETGTAATEKKQRFGVTATMRTHTAFRSRMEEAGKRIVPLVTMRTERLAAYGELKERLAEPGNYDWILFTSKQAVELFFAAMREQEQDIRAFSHCRFAVIGQGTKDALKEHGIYADFVPTHADTETLAEEFAEALLGETAEKERQEACVCAAAGGHMHILFPHARQADPVTAARLREAGADVTELSVYDVKGNGCSGLLRIAELTDFAFFSASGVRAFFKELRARGYALPKGAQFWCIGNPTKEALLWELSRLGKDVLDSYPIHVSKEASVDGLADLILREEAEDGENL